MSNRLPSLRGIETFICVAEVLNFRLASERLNVTVSAISHRIQTLEQELGLQLFDRGNRRLRLTEDGAGLLERLRPGLQILHDATTLTRSKLARPVLRIASPPLVNAWILRCLASFYALQPDIRIELLTLGRRRSASVDVSILPMTANALRDGAVPLAHVRLSPVCSPAFLAAHPIAVPSDLLSLPLIDTIPISKGWSEWFRAAGVSQEAPAPALAVDNQVLLFEAAIEGRGIAMGMGGLVAEYLARGELIQPFSIEYEFVPSLGIHLNESGNIRLARIFAEWIGGYFQGWK